MSGVLGALLVRSRLGNGGLWVTFPLCAWGEGRTGTGPSQAVTEPWMLQGWAPQALPQPDQSLTGPATVPGWRWSVSLPRSWVIHLSICHPLWKPIPVLFFMFFVNIKKVKRIKTFLLQFLHLGCHKVEWLPGLRNAGGAQEEGRLWSWLAVGAGEVRA